MRQLAYETKPHLHSNPGLRGHSVGKQFAKTGAAHFCTLRQGVIEHWVRFPDGLVVRNES